MNKRNKDVEATKLRREDQVLKDLRREYNTAAERVKEKIKTLAEREQSKSVIYQKKYQEQLLNQINSALDSLDTVNTVSDYLKDSYYNGFMGALYDIQGQGIPIIVPFDQNALTKMISTTSDNIKLSKKLYTHVTALKNRVRKEVSIGIAAGEMYDQVAARIDRAANIGFNNAYRIARTEGHRVSQASALEAMQAAKDSGADVVKQWDSTLDGRTRKEHRKLDGQIRELDEQFTVSGRKAMHPGGFGRPEQDINCRCTVLQRAKWALDQDELDELKRRADFFELDKSKDFAEFKKKYLKAAEKITETIKKGTIDRSAQIYKDFAKENIDDVARIVENASGNVKTVWIKYEKDLRMATTKDTRGACFSRYQGVFFNLKSDSKGFESKRFKEPPYATFFHEFGHNIDMLAGRDHKMINFSRDYKDGIFGKTIRNEVKAKLDALEPEIKAEFKKNKMNPKFWFDHGMMNEQTYKSYLENGLPDYYKRKRFSVKLVYGKLKRMMQKEMKDNSYMGDLSDILEGATNGEIKLGMGHGNSYWKNPNNLPSEAFAEFFAATMGNPDSLKTLRKHLPETAKVFEEMLEELTKEN